MSTLATLTPPVTDATRREFFSLIAAAGLLTACASQTAQTADSASPGYPVTVTTPDDGEVVIATAPRRVGALNGNRVIPFLLPFLDADHQLVGYGGAPDPADYPWIAEQLEALPPSADLDGPNVELYATWAADLLIANGNLGDFWEPARAVAPLLQLPETDWRATTRLLGQVFDNAAAAEATVTQTEALIAAARLPTPVTAAVLSRYADNGTLGFQVLGAELPNFLADLGIDVAPSDAALDGYEDVSLELISDRLDVDYVIVLNFGDDLQASLLVDPIFAAVPAVRDGRVVSLTGVQTGAGFPATPPSIPVILEALAPILNAR